MNNILIMLFLLLAAALNGCGSDFEWFPKQNTSFSNTTTQTSAKYVATNQENLGDESFVYHYPSHGLNIINVENVIWFLSASAAKETGRVPCKICNPPLND